MFFAIGAIAWCFLDFLIPLSAKTPSFESISGRPSSKKALKNRCFRWEGYEKVKKTLHNSEVWAIVAVKTYIKCAIWNSSPDLPDLPDQVSAAAVRTLPNTRRRSGWRELKTNSLKFVFLLIRGRYDCLGFNETLFTAAYTTKDTSCLLFVYGVFWTWVPIGPFCYASTYLLQCVCSTSCLCFNRTVLYQCFRVYHRPRLNQTTA